MAKAQLVMASPDTPTERVEVVSCQRKKIDLTVNATDLLVGFDWSCDQLSEFGRPVGG